ncbi:MAG: hypothetical protein U5L75_00870 [Candidatus Campbellbacteria bacterium]|nr:hypothetical protein [Candidatus Campbellbacteria bacterium]
MSEAVQGILYAHFETGTEGVLWALSEDNKSGYDALHLIEEGDFLTIFNQDGQVIFSNWIVKDTETGKRARGFGSDIEQQSAEGLWIHWIQKGWVPDDWAALFLSEKNRAELVKSE